MDGYDDEPRPAGKNTLAPAMLIIVYFQFEVFYVSSAALELKQNIPRLHYERTKAWGINPKIDFLLVLT